jgi:uncharacterized cupredoxin-like copper-binding protein
MVLVALTAMGLAACGDDDEDTAAQTTTTEDPAAKQKRDYCEKSLQIETTQPPPELFQGPPGPQQEQAGKQFVSQLLPLAEEAQRNAPSVIKTDVDLLVNTVRGIAQTGDFSAFEQPNVAAAEARVHTYDLQNCGWNRVDVTGTDYAFQGIPQTLAAGPTSFELVNKAAKEDHELVVLRINDDVKEPVAEILKLPEEQGRQKATPVGGSEPAEPGKTTSAVANLKPGRYAAVCFIPVGGRSGPPHAARGMFAEFTVS